ncbi:LOW QUALITY PROTEIN: uncharacterized protein LOC107481080 [Arachis duranensis]|uniref:LOW QUALITY PROTEIN: uncharacterized protein LOC107481080 n=1 Tax=Arachis duranensis TaxID=130453 RepID=A0A6P4CSV7_ARADU|nr:LOW QUALITY PROTEIN: uncharacterized protein LOC107481080 [Arachis duranensis]
MAPSASLMKACNVNTLSVPIFKPCTNPSSSSRVFFSKSIIELTLHISNSGHNNHHSNNNFPLLSFPSCSSKPDISTDSSDIENKPKGSSEQSSLVSKRQKASKLDKNHASESLTTSPAKSSSSSSSPSRGLVFSLGPSDSWDGAEVGSPVVKRFLSDDEERWFMWYHGRSNNRNPSSSSNGVHWERGSDSARSSSGVGYVMKCGKEWWEFDTKGIRPSEILMMCSSWASASSAAYWLYYTGYTYENVNFNENPCLCFNDDGESLNLFKCLPGLAVSHDGRHWARVEGEHHNGALFDVGDERDWDSLFISSPSVVCHGNSDFRMYYHSFDVEKGHFAIGLARSRDGRRWVKLGKIMGGSGKVGSFEEFGVMNACVVRNLRDGNYVMAYEGVGADGKRSIGVAVSDDGLMDWVRVQDEAVLKPSEIGCWDDKCVGSPCLVQIMDRGTNNDEWRLYYTGVGNGGREGIGMAVGDIRNFRRWRRFHA